MTSISQKAVRRQLVDGKSYHHQHWESQHINIIVVLTGLFTVKD